MPRTSLSLSCMAIGAAVLLSAQQEEGARILRNGDEATLSAFSARPLDSAAISLAEQYGLVVNVEDPLYRYRDDVEDVTAQVSRNPAVARGVLVPKSTLVETRFTLRPDGSLVDARRL